MGSCIASECIMEKHLEKEEIHLASGNARFTDIHGNNYELVLTKPTERALKSILKNSKNKLPKKKSPPKTKKKKQDKEDTEEEDDDLKMEDI